MPKKFTITDNKKKAFANVFLMEYIVNKPHTFSTFLQGRDEALEPLLTDLYNNDFLAIEGSDYVATDKGRELVDRFLKRYSEFLNIFDIYCAVDLEDGDFAFRRYFDFETDEEWHKYLGEDRWDDIRLAVAEAKGIDPIEIVFMSFIREERFGRDEDGWQFDLLLGDVWTEIIEICSSAASVEDLAYDDVSAEEVFEDIFRQGGLLLKELHSEEAELIPAEIDHDEEDDDDEEEAQTTVVYVDSWGGYYGDPFYVSPMWGTPWNSYYYW